MKKIAQNTHILGSIFWIVGLIVLVGVPELLGVFERLELATGDMLLNLRGTRSQAADIMIVAIDQSSVEGSGYQWPLPRDYIAKVIQAIAAGKPSVIAVDILFLEPGPSEEADQILANALREANHTVLAGVISSDQSVQGVYATTIGQPIQILHDSAEAVGLINIPADSDGVVRTLPVNFTWKGTAYHSLAVQVASIYIRQLPNSEYLDFNHLDDGNFAINFRGPVDTFYAVSAVSVAHGEVEPQAFAGKIVLVGVTDERVRDIAAVPFGGFRRPMPGVEIWANAVDTLIARDYIKRIGIGGQIVGLPLPSSEELRFGVYIPDMLQVYLPKLFRSGRIFTLALIVFACLAGYSISNAHRLLIVSYLAIGVLVAYMLLWGVAFLVFRVQVALVAPEIGFVLACVLSVLRRFASRARG